MGELARIDSISELMTIGKAMSASGYFSDAKDANQAIVKILAGREMGFGPFAAMSDIHIIQGKPVVGANLMAAAVKSHPRYDYRVTINTDVEVSIEFYQEGKSIGVSNFTMDDAKAAKLQTKDNWQKFPRNMLFARAISNGVRWYCPDVFSGAAVYTPDEFDVVEVEQPTQKKGISPAGADALPTSRSRGKSKLFKGEEQAPKSIISPPDNVFDNAPVVEMDDAPQLHWIDYPDTRKRFWVWAREQGLSYVDVHAALGVEHVNDFDGDKAAAVEKINHWIDNRSILDEHGA